MRSTALNRRRMCAPRAIAVLLLMTMARDARSQSLADVARQEEVRRRTIVGSGPVYTNADLNRTGRQWVRPTTPAEEPATISPIVAATRVPVAMYTAPAPVPDSRPASPPVVAASIERVPFAFTDAATPAFEAASPAWATFTLSKSAEERESERRQRQNADPGFARMPVSVLPPSRETLKTTAAIGYVQDADWGTEVSAIGTYRGLRTDARAFVTSGPAGLEWYNGWFAVENPDTGWRLAAGDLFSDLRGASRGVRMSWAGRGGRSPAVSLFLPNARLGYGRPALAYRDSVRFGRGITVGGEAATDGAASARGEYRRSKVGFETSFRHATGRFAGRDWGWTASYDLWRGLSVRGGGQYSATTDGRGEGYMVGGQIPLPARITLTVDQTTSRLNGAAHAGQTAMLQFSVGRVRFVQRYGRGTFTVLQAGRPSSVERHQLQTTTSIRPVSWATVQLQVANQWQPDGRVLQWQELASSFRMSRRTQMQAVMALPDVLDPSRLRLRLSHTLSRDFNLDVEYGRLGAFQSITHLNHEQARFRVMVRKSWDVATPAAGSLVRGRISDAAGEPVSGALVRLGAYRVATDQTGAYVFPHVPRGEHELSLDRSQLPASYASTERPRQITARRSSESIENFVLIALDTVRGHVYEDRNGNGQLDKGEGIARVAVRLDAHVTATDQHGAYAFFNVAPGEHEVSVHHERLPAGYGVAAPGTQRVTLVTGQAASPVQFRLIRVERPVIFQ